MSATPKQTSFLTALLNERRNHLEGEGQDVDDLIASLDTDAMDPGRASRWIERLLEIPKDSGQRNGSKREVPSGMYRLEDGTIVRVYLGQQSGTQLAKKLVDTGVPYPKDETGHAAEGTIHEYEYLGAAYRFVPEGTPMLSLAEAKEYGRMSGTCCRCGRRLDVPESVEAGIGPVCATKDEYR